ncbi:MAG: hypothetical protein K2Y27_10715 [Xanthobacteraceae bacterium]|nr:hypothetical protein [Xanthobacteraceae bacterium]
MHPHRNTLLTAALAALLILTHADAGMARTKKSNAGHDLGVQVDSYGVPIIMKGYSTDSRKANRAGLERSGKQASRPIPRGSSTYIPPPVPSPSRATVGAATGPIVQPYNPPPITTFGDRVNNAIQSYPLNKGLGNNPTDMQMYIRQNSN